MPEHEVKETNAPVSTFIPAISETECFDYDRMLISREDIKEEGEMLDQIFSDNYVAEGDLEIFRKKLEEVPEHLHDTPEYNYWDGIYRGRLFWEQNG